MSLYRSVIIFFHDSPWQKPKFCDPLDLEMVIFSVFRDTTVRVPIPKIVENLRFQIILLSIRARKKNNSISCLLLLLLFYNCCCTSFTIFVCSLMAYTGTMVAPICCVMPPASPSCTWEWRICNEGVLHYISAWLQQQIFFRWLTVKLAKFSGKWSQCWNNF